MRLWIILCCLSIACPMVGHAEPIQIYIQKLPSGVINWTTYTLTSTPEISVQATADSSQNSENTTQRQQPTRRQATENLMKTIEQVRINTDCYVADALNQAPQIKANVLQMCQNAKTVTQTHLDGNPAPESVQMGLLGGFMQLMLPEEIRQVEPIKAMSENTAKPLLLPPGDDAERKKADNDGIYSGLIIDARGIGAKPAMVPAIVDETGKQVYGSIFISREYAVQFGVCIYVRGIENPPGYARIAPHPLTVKGLRTVDGRDCDIVISNADAAKLRDASANLGFLKQCRVIIVLD